MAEILIVEDDEDVAYLLEAFLELHGHHVRRAADGEKGLEALTRALPDLVVMDVEMPLLDGPGMATRMIVENAGRERIPILIVSGVHDLSKVAGRVGTPYFLAKPFPPAELTALAERALRERRFPSPGGGPQPALR